MSKTSIACLSGAWLLISVTIWYVFRLPWWIAALIPPIALFFIGFLSYHIEREAREVKFYRREK